MVVSFKKISLNVLSSWFLVFEIHWDSFLAAPQPFYTKFLTLDQWIKKVGKAQNFCTLNSNGQWESLGHCVQHCLQFQVKWRILVTGSVHDVFDLKVFTMVTVVVDDVLFIVFVIVFVESCCCCCHSAPTTAVHPKHHWWCLPCWWHSKNGSSFQTELPSLCCWPQTVGRWQLLECRCPGSSVTQHNHTNLDASCSAQCNCTSDLLSTNVFFTNQLDNDCNKWAQRICFTILLSPLPPA